MKPKAPTTGYVDGAWWPRTRELGRELPALLATLAVRLREIERLTYHLEDWPETPRRIGIEGKRIRVEGFRSQRAGTVTATGTGGRLTPLVVPPEADPGFARDVVMAAAHRDNVETVTALLAVRDAAGYVPRPRIDPWQ